MFSYLMEDDNKTVISEIGFKVHKQKEQS